MTTYKCPICDKPWNMGPTRDYKSGICSFCLMNNFISMRDAVHASNIIIDDLLRCYASDQFMPEQVGETYERIERRGGTLYYISETQQVNRAALGVADLTIGLI